MVHIRSRGDSGTGKRSRKKNAGHCTFLHTNQPRVSLYYIFPHRSLRRNVVLVGSARRKARGFARLPSRHAISRACSWAREIARLEVGAPVRAPGRRHAGSRAFLLTPSAFPLDFWQRRYIFFGRVYVLFMYRVYCREATSHTAQRNRRGAPNYVSRISAGAISAIYMEAEARHLRRKI